MSHRYGVVALVGAPNAGKSTLLNRLVGAHLAIVSSKPQTTRDRIVGVVTRPDSQIVLIDTPGLHAASTELNRAMVKQAEAAVQESDLRLWVVDAIPAARRAERGEPIVQEPERQLASRLPGPRQVALNKIDVIPRPLLLPVMAAYAELVPESAPIPISGLVGDGVEQAIAAILPHLPEGPAAHDADTWTTATERFLVAEIVREKIFHYTEQEVPYATAVEVLQFDETQREAGKLRIMADIIVERDSQKGILIGKGGDMLRRIGTAARRDISELLDARVHLELFVKVEREWSRSLKGLRRVGLKL